MIVNNVLLALLRQGLFSEDVHLPDTTDWNAVLQEAHIQRVTGILKLPDSIPEDVQKRYKQIEAQRISIYIRYLYAQDQLHELLKKAGIPYAILKGCAAAVQYPHPLARSMGDIDFIVPQKHFQECKRLLEENGYVYSHGEEGDRHIVYGKNGFSHELHHHFSHDLPVLDEYINEGLKNTVIAEVEGHAFSMLPSMTNGLVLLDHMRSHLLTGMGLRQMIDWMMYVSCCLDDSLWNNGFHDIARSCGLETLAITATDMCQRYLGLNDTLSWCKEANDELGDRLMDSLIASGNFGQKNGTGAMVEMVTRRLINEGVFQTLQSAGEFNWKALKKHPELKPFAWIYQSFRYITKGISARRGGKLHDDYKRATERAKLVKDLEL